MIAAQADWSHERDTLAELDARYVGNGFTFVAAPRSSDLPAFFGSYVPDAIARRPDLNVAIEIRNSLSLVSQRKIQEIRQLFQEHRDWRLDVVFTGGQPLQTMSIQSATTAAIRERLGDVAALRILGQERAAFVMAWTLLEATLQALDDRLESRPRTPGTVVQTLATNGHIDMETERRLRALIELRNRIVHGDTAAEPTPEATSLLVTAIDRILTDALQQDAVVRT